MAHHHRDVGQLLVHLRVALADPAVLAEQHAVVAHQHHERVVGQAEVLETVEEASEPDVHERDLGGVELAHAAQHPAGEVDVAWCAPRAFRTAGSAPGRRRRSPRRTCRSAAAARPRARGRQRSRPRARRAPGGCGPTRSSPSPRGTPLPRCSPPRRARAGSSRGSSPSGARGWCPEATSGRNGRARAATAGRAAGAARGTCPSTSSTRSNLARKRLCTGSSRCGLSVT